jgi:hypothetical protein
LFEASLARENGTGFAVPAFISSRHSSMDLGARILSTMDLGARIFSTMDSAFVLPQWTFFSDNGIRI